MLFDTPIYVSPFCSLVDSLRLSDALSHLGLSTTQYPVDGPNVTIGPPVDLRDPETQHVPETELYEFLKPHYANRPLATYTYASRERVRRHYEYLLHTQAEADTVTQPDTPTTSLVAAAQALNVEEAVLTYLRVFSAQTDYEGLTWHVDTLIQSVKQELIQLGRLPAEHRQHVHLNRYGAAYTPAGKWVESGSDGQYYTVSYSQPRANHLVKLGEHVIRMSIHHLPIGSLVKFFINDATQEIVDHEHNVNGVYLRTREVGTGVERLVHPARVAAIVKRGNGRVIPQRVPIRTRKAAYNKSYTYPADRRRYVLTQRPDKLILEILHAMEPEHTHWHHRLIERYLKRGVAGIRFYRTWVHSDMDQLYAYHRDLTGPYGATYLVDVNHLKQWCRKNLNRLKRKAKVVRAVVDHYDTLQDLMEDEVDRLRD